MKALLSRAQSEYARTLRVSPNSHERMYNMPYMCFLRDFIAEMEDRTPEEVQAEYEGDVDLVVWNWVPNIVAR